MKSIKDMFNETKELNDRCEALAKSLTTIDIKVCYHSHYDTLVFSIFKQHDGDFEIIQDEAHVKFNVDVTLTGVEIDQTILRINNGICSTK